MSYFVKIIFNISSFLIWSIPIIAGIFAVFVYTPEYARENGWKAFFDNNISLSVLMFLLIIGAILYIMAWISKKLIVQLTSNTEHNTVQVENVKGSKEMEKVPNVLDKFANANKEVVSIQLYKHSEVDLHNTIKYEVKPTDLWFVKTGYSTNLVHESYTIKKTYLRKFIKIKRAYLSGSYNEIEEYIAETSKYFKKFEGNLPNKPKEDDIAKFALLILAFQLNFGSILLKIESIDEEVFDYFISIKRTGFLRSLLEDDFYKFQHEGNSVKADRIYITKCLPINNEQYMFVITANGNNIDKADWNQSLDKVGNKFYDVLSNELKIVKNEYAS
jgi:hypothetical protein